MKQMIAFTEAVYLVFDVGSLESAEYDRCNACRAYSLPYLAISHERPPKVDGEHISAWRIEDGTGVAPVAAASASEDAGVLEIRYPDSSHHQQQRRHHSHVIVALPLRLELCAVPPLLRAALPCIFE